MASDPDLSSVFRQDPHGDGGLDAASVVRRARSRRRPRVAALGAAGVLAAAALVAPIAIAAMPSAQFATPASVGASEESVGDTESSDADRGDLVATPSSSGSELFAEREPYEGAGPGQTGGDGEFCEPVPAVVPTPSRFGLRLEFVGAELIANGGEFVGAVRLVNESEQPVSGYTGGVPRLTLSRDGEPVWQDCGPTTMIAVDVELDPGESIEYQLAVDLGDSDGDVSAWSGPHELAASLEFTPNDDGTSDLVWADRVEIELR